MIPVGSIIESRDALQRVIAAHDRSCEVQNIIRMFTPELHEKRIVPGSKGEILRLPPRPTDATIWPHTQADQALMSFLTKHTFAEDEGRVFESPYRRRWTWNVQDIEVFLHFAGNEAAFVSFLLSLDKGDGTYQCLVRRGKEYRDRSPLFYKGSFDEDPEQTWLPPVLSCLSDNSLAQLIAAAIHPKIREAAAARH